MELILELLETASNQIKEAESTLKKITDKESTLDVELAQLKQLGCKYTKMNEDLQEKRLTFITKLCEALLQTVGETGFMIRKDGLHKASIHSGPAGSVIRYRFTQDPSTYADRSAYPKFFVENGYEKAYQSLCSSMIQTIKTYLRCNPHRIAEQSSILNELLHGVSLFGKI